ncbi:retrovirus-related pol polyprotein from transposon TNT 1-94 [Tanacetum coccineum]
MPKISNVLKEDYGQKDKWVPIGKSNCVLDVHKPQRNPIFSIAVALLKNTNFSKAFTASSMISAIYIQHFWDTMCFNSSTGLYSCHLDEQWFNLHKDILRDALDITPANDNYPFVDPPLSDIVIEYVNTLGYPSTPRNVPAMPRHLVLQILWGIIHRSNINYAKRIWEEFVQSIQTFLTNRKNLAMAARGKKKTAHLLIPSDGREIFGMPILDALLTDEIKGAPYYGDYQEHVAKYQQFFDAERGKAEEGGATESSDATKVTKPKAAKETPDEPSLAKRSKGGLVGKRRKPKSLLKLVDEPSDEGVPVEEPTHTDEEVDLQRALELSLKEQAERTPGPARPMVLREPDSGKYQPLPELPLTDSKIESDEEVPVINAGDQDEGQAGPNLGEQDEGHTGPNPNEEFTTTAHLNVQENLKLPTEDQMILEGPTSSTGTLSSLQNLDKDLRFTDQFFVEKPHEEESGKTNAETEVQSMVSIPIHQDTSSDPLMTTLVIDLTTMQSDSPLPTSIATTSIITTTTSLSPPP